MDAFSGQRLVVITAPGAAVVPEVCDIACARIVVPSD